jgi:hypothetical protein
MDARPPLRPVSGNRGLSREPASGGFGQLQLDGHSFLSEMFSTHNLFPVQNAAIGKDFFRGKKGSRVFRAPGPIRSYACWTIPYRIEQLPVLVVAPDHGQARLFVDGASVLHDIVGWESPTSVP